MSDDEFVNVSECEDDIGVQLNIGGTYASWHHEGRLLSRSVWDALAMPALVFDTSPREILILGLGGGTAARLLRSLYPDTPIVGVELSADVVAAARAHFDLDALKLEVVVENARTFVGRDTRRFDLIVEDIIMHDEDDVLVKPDWLPAPGYDEIRARLRPLGVFASNTIHESAGASAVMASRFPNVARIGVHDCLNHIWIGSEREFDADVLFERVSTHPVLGEVAHLFEFVSGPLIEDSDSAS